MLTFRASINLFATVTVITTYLFLMMVFYTYFHNLPLHQHHQPVKCETGQCKPARETKVPDNSIYIFIYLVLIFTIPCWAIYCAWRLKPAQRFSPLPMAAPSSQIPLPPSENELPPSYQECLINIPVANKVDGEQIQVPKNERKYMKNLRLTLNRIWFGSKPYTVMDNPKPSPAVHNTAVMIKK